MENTIFKKIKQLLDDNKIEYTLSIHGPVRTSEEAAKIRGTDISTGAKAMVVKSGEQYYLCVLPANKKLDWKKVKKVLNVKDVRLATLEEAEIITTVKVGGVPPLGNVMGMPTYYDESLLQIDTVNFNAGLKTHSVSMKTNDLVKLVVPNICSIT